MRIYRSRLFVISIWTLIVALSFTWNLYIQNKQKLILATTIAQIGIDKDVLFRRWAAMHGGVYVPDSLHSPPNPYLKNIPERDIHTPSGKRLTLLNPAYIIRQVHELAAQDPDKSGNISGHITSLNPLRPENAPDPWERSALQRFEHGEKQISEVMMVNSKPLIRLMKPFITESTCLKCHAQQGYKIGDIRGGISISVPLNSLWESSAVHWRTTLIGHLVLWLFCCLLIWVGIGIIRTGEAQLTHALEVAELGTWTLDIKTKKVWRSLRHDQIFGYPKLLPEWTYGVFLDHVVDDDRAAVDEKFGRTLAMMTDWHFECRIRRADGAIRWIEAQGKPLLKHHKVVQMIGLVRDITEYKLMEINLRNAVDAREEFLSIASHELKTPLTALNLQLQLLRKFANKQPIDSKRLTLMSSEAFENSQQLSHLIDELLDLTRINAGKIELKKQEMDLNDAIAEIISIMSEEARQKGSPVEITKSKSIVGMWDPTRIKQIIMNLLSNAIKYGEGKPIEVAVSVDHKMERAKLLIRDHGMGIPRDMQAKIFDRFARAVSDTQISGLGLGLYIVQQIVEAHGGLIHVESEPGNGSTFIVELPLRHDAQ